MLEGTIGVINSGHLGLVSATVRLDIEANIAGGELDAIPKQRPITEEGIPLAIIPTSWCLAEEQKDTNSLEMARKE
jgi:hypothetical protein